MMIEIKGLTKTYRDFAVLKGLDMAVDKGEIYGFIGRNGCGKSTTMNILNGLLAKDGGSVKVGGKEVTVAGELPVGYLPEAPALFDYMTCRQYLDYIGAACRYPGGRRHRTDEVIDLIGLRHAAERKVGGFSRGMKQRVGLGAAVYAGYDLIVLDEPTSALDPEGRAEVMQIIERLKGMGKTILLSTHILTDVERVADKVGILHDGVMAESGSLQELYDKYAQNIVSFSLDRPSAPLCEALQRESYVASFRSDQKGFYVTVEGDFETGSRALLAFLSARPERVVKYEANTVSLEEIYMKVCAENREGGGC